LAVRRQEGKKTATEDREGKQNLPLPVGPQLQASAKAKTVDAVLRIPAVAKTTIEFLGPQYKNKREQRATSGKSWAM
jgi:hypothetical protein